MEENNGDQKQATKGRVRPDLETEEGNFGRESPGGSGQTVQVLKPEDLPRPTYWPAVLAMGMIFILWGLISAIPITFVGVALFILALAGWIREMLS
ncbi:MAG: hypothetical protein P8020_21115 [Acidobacteriota bacterium]